MANFSAEIRLDHGCFMRWCGPELLLETSDVYCNTVSLNFEFVFPITKQAILGLDDVLKNFKDYTLKPLKDTIWVKPVVAMEVFPEPSMAIIPGRMKFKLQINGLYRSHMENECSICFKARQVYIYPPTVLPPLEPTPVIVKKRNK